MPDRKPFNRDDMIRGLLRMHGLAAEEGELLDLTLYGGAAMALVWDLRRLTHDVDAVAADAEQAQLMRRFAAQAAAERAGPKTG